MALTFAEKQKWVATLEAIVNHSGKEERINKAVSMSFTLYLYLYTIFDQRRLDIIDQVEHGRSPQQVTHLPPVWDLLLPLA